MIPLRVVSLSLSLVACASPRTSGLLAATMAPGEPPPRWVDQRVTEGARAVFTTLSSEGPMGLVSLRMRLEDCGPLFTQLGRTRSQSSVSGHAPRESEARWATLRALATSPVIAWCARGLRVAEPNGPEGFAQRALMVDRLLVVGRDLGGFWGVWVQGLVLTSGGWRVLPWVSWNDAVERPRRDHTDVALWDCDRSSISPVHRAVTPAP